MIIIENLSKKYQDLKVLEDISFEIDSGEIIGIIGPSGTGKSTLLRTINRLENPEAGKITIDSKTIDLSSNKKDDIRTIRLHTAMVFQHFNLFERKTALQNVMEGLITVKKIKKAIAKNIALEQLEKVGMLTHAHHYPKHLSGGQQQRVAIARALAMKPNLLLLDEPTSALDPELVGEVLNTIKSLVNTGISMLLVSHEMNFVRNIASRVIFLDKGKIVENGTPSEVFTNPKSERTKQFLQKVKLLEQGEYVI